MPTLTVPVVADGRDETWRIDVEEYSIPLNGNLRYRLTLRAPDESSWAADEADVFEGLMQLRRQVEPGVLICCNGCRRNAWASGMQRDMGGGWAVYLCEEGEPARLDQQHSTFDPVPSTEAVFVAEQVAWHASWWDRSMST